MKIEYDKTADSVYFQIVDSPVWESEEVYPGIIYDYDKNDRVVGIEVLSVKDKTTEQTKSINFPFSKDEKDTLREFFINVFT